MSEFDANAFRAMVKAQVTAKKRATNAMAMFRPTVKQEEFFRAMTADQVSEVAVTGRNRGGKSVAVAVWFASVVLDIPVTMRNGERLHMRPARWRGHEMLCWLVGYDWKHNGETIYRLLFRPGLFKIIEDPTTGLFRSYDPTNPEDAGREDQCKPSPPLITESAVDPDSWSWESKKDRQLQSVKLKKDGTRLVFYASTGEVAAGNPVHVIWVDEKINSDDHYPEWIMRLVDYRGRIVWSSWPTLAPSGEFSNLLERAEDQKDKDAPNAIAFQFKKGDNPYTENATLDYFLSTMSEEEAEARGNGQSNISRWQMYPRFSPHVHRAFGNDPDGDDALAKVLRGEWNGAYWLTKQIPLNWTRYLILDPGTVKCGVLKVAIPPPEFGTVKDDRGNEISAFVVPYREYYFHYKDADQVAAHVKADSDGESFEDFTIDWHAARVTPMGFSGTIGQNYERAFKQVGLRCQRRGSTFGFGDDNPAMRWSKTNGLLNIHKVRGNKIGPGGANTLDSPRLRIVGCQILQKQLATVRRKADVNKQPTDERAPGQKDDILDCCEYAASKEDLIYVPGRSVGPEGITMKSVTNQIRNFLGMNGQPKSADSTIYCGAGRVA